MWQTIEKPFQNTSPLSSHLGKSPQWGSTTKNRPSTNTPIIIRPLQKWRNFCVFFFLILELTDDVKCRLLKCDYFLTYLIYKLFVVECVYNIKYVLFWHYITLTLSVYKFFGSLWITSSKCYFKKNFNRKISIML